MFRRKAALLALVVCSAGALPCLAEGARSAVKRGASDDGRPAPGLDLSSLPAPGLDLSSLPAPTAGPDQKAAPRWLHKGTLGTLAVKSRSEGASVVVDGLEVGTTPLEPFPVSPGAHEVRLTRAGFKDATRRIKVQAGQTAKVSLELQPDSASALELATLPPLPEPELVVPVAAPAGAPAPVTVVQAEPAEEPPLITAAGSLAGNSLPRVEADPAHPAQPAKMPAPAALLEAQQSPLASTESVPLTRRWWFWGGAAVVATALLASVIYALPAQYVERRDPANGCGGGPCGIVVNK